MQSLHFLSVAEGDGVERSNDQVGQNEKQQPNTW